MNGLMLDTTWQLLQKYVVSIPTLIIKNVGIPIGSTFSLIEDIFIYKNFLILFKMFLLGRLKIISTLLNQLRARHLLASLGKPLFAYQIGNLVTAVNKKDFDSLKEMYDGEWNKIKDQKQQQKLKRLLKKVGLSFENGNIVKNKERWREVSMMKRAKFKMLLCTNQLESTYGNLNSGNHEFFENKSTFLEKKIKINLK